MDLPIHPDICSWLNAVEDGAGQGSRDAKHRGMAGGGFFSKMTRQAIRRGVFRSLDDLIATIERYIEDANQHPKPFVWTATASSLMAKLKLNHPSDSVHSSGMSARGRTDFFQLVVDLIREAALKVASNGIRIHVEEQGRGELALVFLHYWGGSSRTWKHVTTALAKSYRTIATDHRGWGASDAPAIGYALADLADDAAGVIRALDLRRYILVGHSMGGKVAQLLASRRPDGLVGLVLVASAPPSPLALPAQAREMMAGAYSTRETVEMTIDQVLTAKPLDPTDRAQVIADSLRGAPQAKKAWPVSISQEDISEAVTAIEVPTLVISGEMDSVDTVEAVRSELMPRIPGAVLHVLPGTGHLSPLESPVDLVGIIDRFAMGQA